MSTLQVQTLQGPTSGADSNTVRVADNHKLYAKGHVVQVQTYHVAAVNGNIATTSTVFLNSGAAVTITPQFSNSLIVCDFVTTMSAVDKASSGYLHTRLLLNNVEYGGVPNTAGYMQLSSTTASSYNPTTFKTVHTTLAAGTAVEFKLQFKSDVQVVNSVILAYGDKFHNNDSIGDSTVSSLQVDSIAAIGGGHVDGTGEVVQVVQDSRITHPQVRS